MKKIAGLLLCVPMLMGNDSSGCSTTAPSVPIQPVTIGVSDFCEIMKATLPPTGKPSWDVSDSVPTITDARRVGAAVDSRCGMPIVSDPVPRRQTAQR